MVYPKHRLRRHVACAASVAVALVAAVAAAAHSPFPIQLHTAGGVVTIPRRPTRIVSISPSATQDLYAVGAGSRVVAVDSFSTYPPQAPRTSLSPYTPNIEAIARYRPDLVVVPEDTENVVEQLRKLRIPTLLEPAATNLGDVYAQIDQLAAATGNARGASGVVGHLKAQIDAIVHSVPRPRTPLKVYMEFQASPTYYAATSHTFVGQLLGLLGLENIADKAGGSYPQLSAEYIVASDPDLIVLADTVCCHQSLRTVAARPGWGKIAAVKTGAVIGVDDSVAAEWGPRFVLMLSAVADAVRLLEAKHPTAGARDG
jgi:iron complex transport system substrate-binding protein